MTDNLAARALEIVTTSPRFRVVYAKKDGQTLRTATGTARIVPQSDRPPPSGYVCYFDFGIMAFRSFYLDNVKSIEPLAPITNDNDQA